MKIALLGFAQEGQAAYEYWKDGNEITVCDRNPDTKIPDGVRSQLGKDYLRNLDRFDLLVRTPNLHPGDIVRANSPDILDKVTTVTNEFFRVAPTKNLIGVTGTKGKGTTSTLIAKMLEAAGQRVHLGGNIGLPLLELLKKDIKAEDYVVMELSSFQLIDLRASPHIGVCLMVVPEHLDWHEDHDEYVSAKQQLFMNQDENDVAIYYAKNEHSEAIADASTGKQIPYFAPPGAFVENDDIVIDGQSICSTTELKLLGQHNWQNACAAVTAVWQVTQDAEALRSVLTNFSGLAHRLELIRELDGVKYYDDSFGTTPETAVVAIEAFKEPKVLILGGSVKGSSFEELAKTVAESDMRQVILIGNTANPDYESASPQIEKALKNAGVTNVTSTVKPGGTSMKEIVALTKQHAKPGDVVLLSAGCASFDMFKNYKDRAEQFSRAVLELV